MSQKIFNERIKQILILGIILLLIITVITELVTFIPGLLGAVTLYIVSRRKYFHFVYNKKWKKGWTALGFIIFYLIVIGIPISLAITLISPKINTVLEDPNKILNSAKHTIAVIQGKVGFNLISENTLSNVVNKITTVVPKILNSTLTLVSNLAIMLFILYYMLYNGSNIEKYLSRAMPLKRRNVKILSDETKKVVIANALGIPLISIIQGVIATIGYALFGVEDWGLYGFLTGVCAFFPVVGTMIVWVPVTIYMFATGDTLNATLLLLYHVVITGNVDYVARITLLKRIGDTHPVITIMGVLLGLSLFGFVGLVFGPLLLSYLIVLYDIYMNEFVHDHPEDEDELEPAALSPKLVDEHPKNDG
ncbi:AI-2E family transporter [Niabella ginsengisoli]|uniref:AI-2E family transporter n=1 Tax=Niabella ginsengisoli TaxID=522298 RepID=A0ABS9SIL5_9BACT|nr:AI-2E family transporter [Niabella ginsengisoli]MCH5598201.1 AI-2E family transporter [Niabella ginsengisoli]